MPQLEVVPRDLREREFQPFPMLERRNWFQEHVEVPVMIKLLGLPSRAHILEVGCGCGIALLAFARTLSPQRLVGLDIDPNLLHMARTRLSHTGTDLILGDVRDMAFDDVEFDVVIDFGTCYHISRPEDAVAEIARVLRPGGMFVTETRVNQLFAHPIR